jgi:hypothetical protein
VEGILKAYTTIKDSYKGEGNLYEGRGKSERGFYYVTKQE